MDGFAEHLAASPGWWLTLFNNQIEMLQAVQSPFLYCYTHRSPFHCLKKVALASSSSCVLCLGQGGQLRYCPRLSNAVDDAS
jgi:hypothetical protein